MKVLIVDDDPNTVQMIEDSIPWEEYGISETFAAYHGQMAMEIIGKDETVARIHTALKKLGVE